MHLKLQNDETCQLLTGGKANQWLKEIYNIQYVVELVRKMNLKLKNLGNGFSSTHAHTHIYTVIYMYIYIYILSDSE